MREKEFKGKLLVAGICLLVLVLLVVFDKGERMETDLREKTESGTDIGTTKGEKEEENTDGENAGGEKADDKRNGSQGDTILPVEKSVVCKREVVWIVKQQGERVVTDKGEFLCGEAYKEEELVDGKAFEVIHDGLSIRYVLKESREEICLSNVWIVSAKESLFDVYVQGCQVQLSAKGKLEQELAGVVADLHIVEGLIIKVVLKQERISGKVLRIADGSIEIDGYGTVPFAKDFRMYKVYGELGREVTERILVGYENTDFVVSGGEICAALFTEPIKAEKIRVLLGTNQYKGYYHEGAIFSSEDDFLVRTPTGEKKVPAGEVYVVTKEQAKEGRITLTSTREEGKISVLSLLRDQGTPAYRGSIEVTVQEEGLLLVNELSIEEYLYAVIPSEMPTYYGQEALKVQAVCARSYAYKQLLENRFARYGAHVDDSVACQVYQNIAESEASILAVKDTYGQVLSDGEEVITAYYFSTSCGATTNAEEVWLNHEKENYLTGSMQTLHQKTENSKENLEIGSLQPSDPNSDIIGNIPEEESEHTEQKRAEESRAKELSDEMVFREFLTSDEATYDSNHSWYRWQVTLSAEQIRDAVNQYAKARYQVNPVSILTLEKGSLKEDISGTLSETGEGFVRKAPELIEEILSIEVRKRGVGGIVTELLVRGSNTSLLIKTEYNIRTLLSPLGADLIRKDGSVVRNMQMLPSAFLVIDAGEKNPVNGAPLEYTISGGGYGHGVGMSQNGVRTMTELGYKYEEILNHYYNGTVLGDLYQ